ncbi:uncharacterized protein LOC124354546 isoform X5 [Homalodisca vitripennis]|uniref:uncharacterized protein LOC124354546 isoform X5 n=1 Tax=Homalodisca vitripennis TaxID=197043 RepID=UPI001EEC7B77|nr:uncharacterized protein LOC124354546 isoform X5 [Homalodisca vitripennis]
MAATVKHTTILVVVQAFVHLHVEAAQLGLNREKAKSARYDKEKFGIHLDTLQGRNQAAETFREVETPLEKQLQYTNFNRKIENSKLWQEFKTRLNTAKLGLQRTDPLLKLDNDRPILNYRVKRKTKLSEKQQEKLRTDQQFRAKREVVIHPQLKPEMVMQPRIEMPMEKEAEEKRQNVPLNFHFYNPSIYYPEVIDSLANKSGSYQEKLSQNREKRQVLYLLDGRGVPLLFRPVRTTPNPFIRQTNIEDYEIVRPNLGEEFRPIAGDDADSDSSDVESSYQLSQFQNVLNEISKNLLSLRERLVENQNGLSSISSTRIKRSPKMSKLKKKQKLAKKKRKKKKQQKLTPRQIKHYRRIREHKEERRKILHKRLKEKRRLRHKKMGTGPYNKTIIDYYGVYFDPPSSQINDSLYDSIYDSDAVDSEKMYEEAMKNYPDSGVEGEEYEDSEEELYEDDEEGKSIDEGGGGDGGGGVGMDVGNKPKETKNKEKTSENESKKNKCSAHDSNNKIHPFYKKDVLKIQTRKGTGNRDGYKYENVNYYKTKQEIDSSIKTQTQSKVLNPQMNLANNNYNIMKEKSKPKNIKYSNIYKLPLISSNTAPKQNSEFLNVVFDSDLSFNSHYNGANVPQLLKPIKTDTYENIVPILHSNNFQLIRFQ